MCGSIQLIATDNWLTANVALVAERKAALGKAPAYVYHFEKPTPVHDGKLGVPHTVEVSYVFDNLDVPDRRRHHRHRQGSLSPGRQDEPRLDQFRPHRQSQCRRVCRNGGPIRHRIVR